MTGAEWARQEHLAMLGASSQARNITEAGAQADRDAKETR